jgi:hypothetical protein
MRSDSRRFFRVASLFVFGEFLSSFMLPSNGAVGLSLKLVTVVDGI